MVKRIAVIGSRSELAGPDELAAAQRVGRLLGERGLTLVYDGSALGSLGALAESAVKAGGRLAAVVIDSDAAPLRDDLVERRRVDDRDGWRADVGGLADAWLGLPGAFERLEDAFDVWGWAARPPREQPLGLLDQADYYTALLRTASDPAVDRFVLESQRGRLVVGKDAAEMLHRLTEYRPPETRRDGFDDD